MGRVRDELNTPLKSIDHCERLQRLQPGSTGDDKCCVVNPIQSFLPIDPSDAVVKYNSMTDPSLTTISKAEAVSMIGDNLLNIANYINEMNERQGSEDPVFTEFDPAVNRLKFLGSDELHDKVQETANKYLPGYLNGSVHKLAPREINDLLVVIKNMGTEEFVKCHGNLQTQIELSKSMTQPNQTTPRIVHKMLSSFMTPPNVGNLSISNNSTPINLVEYAFANINLQQEAQTTPPRLPLPMYLTSTASPRRNYPRQNQAMVAKDMRIKRSVSSKPTKCDFCHSNGESYSMYTSQVIRDSENKISCPILRKKKCELCNYPGGDYAHTAKYCPKRKELGDKGIDVDIPRRLIKTSNRTSNGPRTKFHHL